LLNQIHVRFPESLVNVQFAREGKVLEVVASLDCLKKPTIGIFINQKRRFRISTTSRLLGTDASRSPFGAFGGTGVRWLGSAETSGFGSLASRDRLFGLLARFLARTQGTSNRRSFRRRRKVSGLRSRSLRAIFLFRL
jgi:hypothetical protein